MVNLSKTGCTDKHLLYTFLKCAVEHIYTYILTKQKHLHDFNSHSKSVKLKKILGVLI